MVSTAQFAEIASPAVARMMESIMQVAGESAPQRPPLSTSPCDAAMRAARTCYDHLAGGLGVGLADVLVERGFVELQADAGLVTDSGLAFFAEIGLDAAALAQRRGRRSGRLLCRPCLDWSERRPHLAGVLGAALCSHTFDQGWVRRVDGGRAVAVTPKGHEVFRDRFQARLS